MSPGLRKLALTAHLVTSVGWMGAVAVFLALSIAGLTNRDGEVVRAAYIAMDLTTRYVIVPLAVASLVTGLVSSLGTWWGLVRHYWVLLKLVLTVPSTILLLVHTQAISYAANAAAKTGLSGVDLSKLRFQLVFDAAAGLLVLLLVTALSVYKPRGQTPYGRLKQRERRRIARQRALSRLRDHQTASPPRASSPPS